MRRIAATAVLVAVWIGLWQQLSVANLLSGTAVAAAILWLFPVITADPSRRPVVRPLRALHFLGYFLVNLAEASAVVAWEIVTPTNRINQGVVAVRIRGASDALVTLVANAISLTPGTLTVEVGRGATVLYVHVLHLRDVDEVRRDVLRLEALAIRAFGGRPALDALRSGDATSHPDGEVDNP